MCDVEALRTLVDAIEDELRTHQPMTYPAGLFIRIKTVLEGLVSAPVKGGGKLADLIDDVIEEWQENQWSDHPKESKPLADTVADAVAGFVSAPKCECGHLDSFHDVNLGCSGSHHDSVPCAGFRLPVAPVPVYEYGVRYGDGTYARFAGTRAEAENKLCVKFGDRVVYRVAQIPAVPASEWEPVEVDKQ